jgi:hypothetical protein
MPALQQTFVFNAAPPQLGTEFSQPSEEDFPAIQFKYGGLQHVYKNTTDYVRTVLDACPIKKQHKNIVVDVKVTQIRKGKTPCLPGWHCDTVIDPRNPTTPENHFLFVSGQASLTEFIADPVELEIPDGLQHQAMLHKFRKQIANIDPSILKIPSCQIAGCSRFHFHRGSLGLFDEKRLLIRVTETDLVTPNNRPYQRR